MSVHYFHSGQTGDAVESVWQLTSFAVSKKNIQMALYMSMCFDVLLLVDVCSMIIDCVLILQILMGLFIKRDVTVAGSYSIVAK